MTDWTTARVTPEMLAELRRLLDEAPPPPYRDSPATHGDPSNGPTYVALEAQWEGRWEEVATGNYEKWCGMGIALAAAAVNALPALLDAAAERDALAATVERVRALATEWATQPTDYDEDTEQQIEDGGAILRALDATPETGGES